MNILGNNLTLILASAESAEELLPAFNGDAQFLRWSGYPSGMMSLSQVRDDIQETSELPGGTTWRIADREGGLIGVAETAFHPSANVGWIALLIIRREFQGRGYGREVAALLKDYLFSSSEVTELGLGVLVQNTPAQAFWESCGYVRNARHRDTHGNDCYVYRLPHPTVGV
ncbi:GNAT family N-acetyltransferase [Ktedonobacter racemifer]|uniref:GCN5-related N-acetyltransferase n=1 Tax=Ktedonobacter racemifer DSM 44963 TaxID=485913 RepID=D6U675_KTERA|nr:GNAT family protein [Ktedonobacter racemifer]EFH80486.1 GCN5-related N-acetyltransferase [Ktedonobacter racemifer DSM 44963]